MKKISVDEMKKLMACYSKKAIYARAYVVFKKSNFDSKCSLEARTYEVYSNANFFKNGGSLPGFAVDGSKLGVDLWPLIDWEVDYCYMDPANPAL